ncbi:epidermal growth factor receptor kinase substrate 8-like isoform X1 [Vespa velutina]|uniref:epidermal growth factor receptor kinase substrate 8-like isoform X1 n=1 Tax=Vespa velutina TaxID=202808 RepID=UPI001FB5120C|nr:epidermal growth factor receptor kinase substrate 8-like isoform X1 [Vespa velutina]XP_047368941.1 epidermal growth factor receptor kinase substrate 8-like isoform X1 [Vespa velutina]XP_047368942.1 epidermal growth factor receptor kinase substrate 8-like isoform X1 [Vespa velutina]XP_047368943.1 epidermal growth factor receptor kinase substrate 8-like isoform X1 [Vespa velutina]XP_047368944.1 epidermal growth factor receptor kinase substrate 8-like isoform X1 [Vespa velutina]XP_047368945.1 
MPYYNSSHSPAVYNKDGGSSGPSSTSGGRGSSTEPPTYMMEHLATFTVTKEIGIVYPADGMRRLLQLEKSNGIWSQKMQLRLERNWVLIMDNETGAVMERFPASLIQEPTAFTSRDPMEMYNNILVFSVADDSGSQRAEMHIFQCQSVSAQDLVEDLKMLQMGKLVPGGSPRGPRGQIPPPPALPPPEPPLNGVNVREQVSAFNAANADGQNDISREENNDEVSSTSSEKYERDVTILNHCFDDIEKFIARLQYAAAASRELERRRRNRKSKKRNLGDGMLTMRAKPPPEMEFIDIFQKFKLSFNLLAKLKAHIHDPNAPELVHFLFTPLALIVDASHDTNYEPNLPSKVVSPLLTREAVNLLINCVTSKETELWHSLGDMWLIPRDQWKGHVPPYHPIFTDGWSPEYPIPEDRDHDHLASLLNADKQKRDELPEQQNDPYYNHRDVDESHYSSDYLEYDIREDRAGTENFDRNYGTTSELYAREERVEQTRAHSDISVDSIERAPRGAAIERAQEVWLDELVNRNAKIVHVTYPRTANNDKELTVVRGEYLEILDDSRKWWKARNSRGQVAHVPHTIVTPHNPSQPAENDVFNNPLYTSRYPRQGHGYSYEDSEIERTSTSPGPEAAHRTHAIPPPAPADWVRKERLGKKENLTTSNEVSSTNNVSSNTLGKTQTMEKKNGPIVIIQPLQMTTLKNKLKNNAPKPLTPIPLASPAPPASQTPSAPPPLPVPPALSPPPPPPPPPPVLQTQKSTTSTGSNKSELYKNNKSLAGTCNQDQVQEELKHVLNMFRQKKRSPNILEMQATVLHQYSTPREVQSWLTAKGFSDKVCKQLKDMTGAEIFNLTKRQLEQYFGPNEGERLEKQLILSRNECGYETTRVSELKQILEKVRQKAE